MKWLPDTYIYCNCCNFLYIKKRAKFWSSFIHIIDFASHLPLEQLSLCTFTHTPFADEPRFPNSYFCLVFFGRKTIPSSYHLFPFQLLKKQIQFGPTKTTFFTFFSHFIFYWVLFSLHLLSSEKYWEFVSIEKSSGNGILLLYLNGTSLLYK